MNIQGIGHYGFQNYIPREINTVDARTVKKQDEEKALLQQNQPLIEYAGDGLSEIRFDDSKEKASKIANLQDISLSFNAEDDYSYLGKESSLESLDVQKAISDMKKDSILQEYQYFVGNSGVGDGMMLNSTDGMVVQKF